MSANRELLNLKVTVQGRWFRVAAYWGSAPGSHMGFWRSNAFGLRGWNYRVGNLNRCLTAFVHTKRA